MTTIELDEAQRRAALDEATYDDGAFAAMIEHHRRSLRGHCYRILRAPDQAEDAVQQTLLHAWRARGSFARRGELAAWLHRIATNVCFDELERRQRRVRPHRIRERVVPVVRCVDGEPEVAAPASTEPDAQLVASESLAQACLTIFTLLSPKQRAVLILRDVLRWSAADTADLLGASVAAVNSTLQRARAALAEARERPGNAAPGDVALSPSDRLQLGRYVDAITRPDPAAAVAAARVDVGDGWAPQHGRRHGRSSRHGS